MRKLAAMAAGRGRSGDKRDRDPDGPIRTLVVAHGQGISISGKQRDGLYQVLLTELSTFDDLRSAYERQDADIEKSKTLGRMVADALRLIVDGGVGWGDLSGEDRVELTLPDSELQELLGRVRCAADRLINALKPGHEETLEKLQEVELGRDACTEMLAQFRQVRRP